MLQISTAALQHELLSYFDEWCRRFRERVDGLSQDEYLWEPVPGCWSVRATPAGPQVERIEPEPDPAPFTTIAWRMWHIVIECLDDYAGRVFGRRGTQLTDRAFTLEATEAVDLLDVAAANFRAGLVDMGPDWLLAQLGPAYGLYADATFYGLMLHVVDELVHHGAEVALLRDLHRAERFS
jgi:hypothetical protein